jgi:hypothetical protein
MYIRMSAFDASHGWESVKLSFLVGRPTEEPGFILVIRAPAPAVRGPIPVLTTPDWA